MKRIILILSLILFLANTAKTQCLANYKEALSVCQGTYLKHFELNKFSVSSISLVLNKNSSYLFYLVNPSIDIKKYSLTYKIGTLEYSFLNYMNSDNYKSYLLTVEETGIYEINLHIDTTINACVLLGLFNINDKQETKYFSQKDNPPGTMKVAKNLYMDQTEVSNIGWKEYVSYNKKIFGKDSKEYKQSLPDTLVWRQEKSYNEPYVKYYIQHPAYDQYPVVGISYEQAIAFCKWRSDLVNEMVHINNHKKEYNNGEDIGSAPEIYRYRLPTKAEWERYASVDLPEKSKKEMTKHNIALGNFKSPQKEFTGFPNTKGNPSSITAPVHSYWSNNLGLFNMFGNVAEMVAEKGIAKGGSWVHTQEESTVKKDFTYTKPTCWLGFRCICEKAKEIEIYNNYVEFDKNRYVSIYETTNKEYNEFLNYLKSLGEKELFNKYRPDSIQWKNSSFSYNEPLVYMYNWHAAFSNYPVVNITQEAMEAYCEWKSQKYLLNSGLSAKKVLFRLPTEEEWIKFSSPKLGQILPWYIPNNDDCPHANLKIWDYSKNSYNYVFDGGLHTIVVGKYSPNDLGIYDVIGNVAEMTQEGKIKGGSWNNTLEESEITKSQDFKLPSPCVGFRVVMEIVE